MPSELQMVGYAGERAVCEYVKCPNGCGRTFVRFSNSQLGIDVTCRNCRYDAQIKTVNHKGDNMSFPFTLRGGAWSIQKRLISKNRLPHLYILPWTRNGVATIFSLPPEFQTPEMVTRNPKPLPRNPNYYMTTIDIRKALSPPVRITPEISLIKFWY